MANFLRNRDLRFIFYPGFFQNSSAASGLWFFIGIMFPYPWGWLSPQIPAACL